MNLHGQLRLYLKEKDMTVARLARQSKVPVQTLRDWISGTVPRDIRQVKKVAEILGTNVDHLCFGSGLKKESKLDELKAEINAGVFEVILRKVRK